jgi:hypothetical protein
LSCALFKSTRQINLYGASPAHTTNMFPCALSKRTANSAPPGPTAHPWPLSPPNPPPSLKKPPSVPRPPHRSALPDSALSTGMQGSSSLSNPPALPSLPSLRIHSISRCWWARRPRAAGHTGRGAAAALSSWPRRWRSRGGPSSWSRRRRRPRRPELLAAPVEESAAAPSSLPRRWRRPARDPEAT